MLGAYFLLSAVGIGPAVVLTSSTYKRRILVSASLSPVLGLIVIAFFLYILFLLGIPIQDSALPVTIGAIILSTILIALDRRMRPQDYKDALHNISRFRLATIIIGWLIILYLLLLPAIIGGEKYQYYQGNSYDATSYTLMAIFGRDFPAAYVGNSANYSEILQHNPTLAIVMTGIANQRPSVSHLLAWQAVLFNQPSISLYYFTKLLSLLVTATIAAALAYQLGLSSWQQLALMVVSAVGFWAVFVSDIDALSHIYSIPLSLLVVFTFIQFERGDRSLLFSRNRWFLALAVAALVCFYPEITLPFISVILIYYALEFLFNPSRLIFKIVALHGLTLCMIVFFLNIMLSPTLNFAQSQSQFALQGGNTKIWAGSYFSWLFYDRNPFFGLWGLRNLTSESNGTISPEILKAALLLILFIVISTIVGSGVLKSLTNRSTPPETRFLAILIIVYWGGGILLYLIASDWVAGKTLAMGAPFVILGIFVFFRDYFSHQNLLNWLLQIGFVCWIFVQLLTLPFRALAISNILHVPDTVQLSQNAFPEVILPIVERLKKENISQIGLDLGNSKPPIVFTLALSLSDLAPTVFNDGIPVYFDVNPDAERWVATESIPDHIVVVDSRDYLKPLGIGQALITVPAASLMSNIKYVTAYAINPDEYDQALYRANILTPDIPSAPVFRGLDAAYVLDKSFVRWMVKDSTEIHFISSNSQKLGVIMESSAAYDGNMNIEFNGVPAGYFLMKKTVQMASNSICVSTKRGSNILTFFHEDIDSNDINKVLVHKLLFAPIDIIDIGAVGDARQVGKGWESQENWGEETIRWATQDAQLQIMTCGKSDQSELHFRAYLPPESGSQNVSVYINGNDIGTIEMAAGWKEYSVTISKGLLPTAGLQLIEIRHSNTFVPTNDTRMLSAAYDRFWITNN